MSSSMFHNGVNCDVYIGTGAGSMIDRHIKNANKSIKIVSPYLNPHLVEKLIHLKRKGREISLITNTEIEDFYGSVSKRNIYELIHQVKTTDKDAVKRQEKYKNTSQILLYVTGGLILLLLGLYYFTAKAEVAVGLVPILILLLVYNMYRSKAKNTKIYNYHYEKLFPFKVCLPDSYANNSFTIHSKIFIIDNRTAFLGSLNFTKSGFEDNHETRVKIEDPTVVRKINDEFNALFNNPNIKEADIQKIGSRLYPEPIN
ncbi:phospholipase D family protein [Fodinibius sp. Rm-B-1B1-1]|uniref:phospholipase D family protein n=1 Tax=Fodinibius alkaliphilus TaxID=3140241 RepID=UPI00315ADB6C